MLNKLGNKIMVYIFVVLLLGSPSLALAKNEQMLPNLNFYTAQGKKISFKDLRGKVLIVNFFATYCPPCQVELIEFTELYKELHPRGLEIVSFMVDRGGEVLLPHIIASRGINYYVAIANDSILAAFGWPDILPTTFLVDRQGHIVRKIVGFAGKKTLEKDLEKLLGSES